MPALAEVQRLVAKAMLDGVLDPAAALVAGDGVSGEARLRIHRNNIFTTLTESLAATFPVVRQLVDQRFFAFACDRFIPQHPPRSPCLNEYGLAFPDFLAGFEPCRHLVYLPDVARFEWLQNEALHAAELLPLDPATLKDDMASGAAFGFALQPSYRVMESPWPVDRIWLAHQAGNEAVSGDLGVVDLGAGGVDLEIHRRNEAVAFATLERPEFVFRRAIADGATLEHATAAALAADPFFDLVIALRRLLAAGLVVDSRQHA
jgi:hypothetical protein